MKKRILAVVLVGMTVISAMMIIPWRRSRQFC